MVDIKYLASRGVCSKAYKPLFTKPRADRDPAINRLVDQIADRIRAGRDNNIQDYKAFAAIDLAYEIPFNQTTPTIVQSIISQRLNPEETLKALKSWGLSEDSLFLQIEADGKKMWQINPPVFYNILIPLVKAYVTIRASKIFNDRNQNPLLPYRPLKQSDRNLVLCDIITDFINNISTGYGYSAVLRSAITQALKYGVAVAFPREEWRVEEQVMFGKNRRGLEKDILVTVKEGLRYIFPHPTRLSYDLQYPLTSVNTDTGTEFAMYWSVRRYGDILDNRRYWNRQMITYGSNWFEAPVAHNYFQEVYPCTIKFPSINSADDRESRSAYYSTNDRDSAVFVAEYFAKIVPSRWGLGDYKYPVWHRFTLASDDTVIWAAPCAYTPVWMMGYDYDDQSAKQSSFALECIPWQDHIGNILSQMILTAKQNLANVIYYDSNLVNKDEVDKVRNLGETRYRSMNFIPFDGLKMARMGTTPDKLFQPIQFAFRDISQLGQGLSTALNIMERVLQMSSQEVGAAAQHYQSAKEISVTQNATTNRLAFTASFIDDGIEAWKRQLYEAAMAYADTDILAQIDPERKNLPQILADIGFENQFEGQDRVVVKGKKDALRLDGFARSDNSSNREADRELAQTIYQTIGAIAQREELFTAIGVKTIVSMLEEAAHLQGAKSDFRLKLDKDATPGGIKAILQNAQQQVLQFVQEKIAAPAAQEMAKQSARVDQVEQVLKQLQQIYNVAQSQMEKNQVAVAEAQQRMQIKQAEFQQDQARKQQAFEMELQRKAATVQIDQQMLAAQTQADLAAKAAQAQAAIETKAGQAEADITMRSMQTEASIAATHRQSQAKAEATILQGDAAATARLQEAAAATEARRGESSAIVETKKAESSAGIDMKKAESAANEELRKAEAKAVANTEKRTSQKPSKANK